MIRSILLLFARFSLGGSTRSTKPTSMVPSNTTLPVSRRRLEDGIIETAQELRNAVASYFQDPQSTIRYGQTIEAWDVSRVTDFSGLFADSALSDNLRGWDVSNAMSTANMFANAVNFNGEISSWDVTKVTDMNGMFRGASAFNADLSNWDTSSVEDMGFMFNNALSFNQDISDWDVSNVDDMGFMFNTATMFNEPLRNWDVSNVMNTERMFFGASSFNQDLCAWRTKLPTSANVNEMFGGDSTTPPTSCPSQQATPLLPDGPMCFLCAGQDSGGCNGLFDVLCWGAFLFRLVFVCVFGLFCQA